MVSLFEDLVTGIASVENLISNACFGFCCPVLNSSRVVLLHIFFDKFSNQKIFSKCKYKNLEHFNVCHICLADICDSVIDLRLFSLLPDLEFEGV